MHATLHSAAITNFRFPVLLVFGALIAPLFDTAKIEAWQLSVDVKTQATRFSILLLAAALHLAHRLECSY
jgi:hypothetical protein